ncbi:MAG TPA: hypothetical protein VGM19_06510 [Armatimonadota bacterium]|jgi:hypothetical protein
MCFGFRVLLAFSLLLLASACLADSASLLTPLTATGYLPADSAPALAADANGRVMVVYLGKGPDAKWKLYSLLNSGGSWAQTALPMPPTGAYPSELTPLQLVSRTPADGFHLIAGYYSHLYYWHWKAGSWSPCEQVTEGGALGAGLAVDASLQPLIARSSTRFRLYRKVGQTWPETVLPPATAQHSLPAIYAGQRGRPVLFGLSRKTPLIACQAPGHDLGQAADWQYLPPGASTGWTSAVPTATTRDRWALDWPHQRAYAAWPLTAGLRVGSAPVGATTATDWQTSEITLPEHTTLRDGTLGVASSGYGAVALAYQCLAAGAPSLHFHWLSATGPGPDLAPDRPGTQTEASVFVSMATDSLGLSVAPSGTAYLVVKAVKRGEIPAGTARLFFCSVTGGGSSPHDPDAGGGATAGTTGGATEPEGPQPDFTVAVDTPDQALTAGVLRLTYTGDRNGMTPRLQITNQGAQYFGDLKIKAVIDGAVFNVTLPDESGHQLPLFTRGQTKSVYLPRILYETAYQATPPPTTTYTIGVPGKPQTVRLYSGLGRKRLSVTVDPDNAITEADETNNAAQLDYTLYDGRNVNDRRKPAAGATVYGLNDLAVTLPRLLGNTQLLTAGYVQRPTRFDVLVVNPLRAGVFPGATVVLSLDGRELARQTVPPLDRLPNLVLGLMGPTRYYGQQPKPDTSGVMLHFPVDLTAVAEGNHTLQVVVDPEDQFADLQRDNNTATLDFRVRPPGGTVRVHVKDFTNPNVPVAGAFVNLKSWWVGWTDAHGLETIPDVPAGTYGPETILGQRESPPRYYPGTTAAFTVVNNQPVDVSLVLERSITLVGDVRVAGTGALLTDEGISVGIADPDLVLNAQINGAHYRLEDVPPGRHRLLAGAYGYVTLDTTTTAARATGTDECRLDLTLTDGPRATVTGTVQEKISSTGTPRALAGALVWLQEAPRGAETDASGHYIFTRVVAGPDYTVCAMAQNHADASAGLAALISGQTATAPPLVLPQIQQKLTTIDFDATTWALCEEAPAMGDIAAIRVDTKLGAFKGALGLMSHTAVGSPQAHADYLLLWLEGGNFCEGGVSSTLSVESLTGVELDTLKVGPMKDLIEGMGKVFTVVQGINKLADWLYGDLDPSQIHRNNEITATYTTHTGTEFKQDPLIDLPTSLEVPVAMTFVGGGTTIVRVDHILLSDSSGQKKRIVAEWYSPGFAVFKLDQDVDLPSAEVKLEVAVLNDRQSSGLLGNASRNLIHWKPGQAHWLRISGYQYPD